MAPQIPSVLPAVSAPCLEPSCSPALGSERARDGGTAAIEGSELGEHSWAPWGWAPAARWMLRGWESIPGLPGDGDLQPGGC